MKCSPFNFELCIQTGVFRKKKLVAGGHDRKKHPLYTMGGWSLGAITYLVKLAHDRKRPGAPKGKE